MKDDDYTPTLQDKIYDEQIAPKLLEACQISQTNGMSFFCVVEINKGNYGHTLNLCEGHDFTMPMTEACARAKGNFDTFMIAMIRHAKKYGHGSAYLSMLNVPTTPTRES